MPIKFDLTNPPVATNLEQANALLQEAWAHMADLEGRLAASSSNSSKPPSSDGPDKKRKDKSSRNKPNSNKQTKKRGAQPGHAGSKRTLETLREDDTQVIVVPDVCCPCCAGLVTPHPQPYYRHQVFEIPPRHYTITEYQLFAGACTNCGEKVKATLPDTAPSGQMGPNLMSQIALFSGQYHQSIGNIQSLLQEIYGLRFSTGAISEAQGRISSMLTPLHQAIKAHVRQADVIFADETSHQRDNESRWMWLITCDDAACFNTHYSRGKLAAKKLLGEQVNGFVVTDQYAGYHWLEDTQRQLCWAHILRNVTQIAEYSGGGYTAKVGQQLVLRIEAIFRTQHRFEDGYITDAVYRRRMKRLRLSWQKQLGLGLEIPASRYQGRCKYLLKHGESCWTFLRADGRVPLTNNEAERRLRRYVVWRKCSYGVRSHRGEQFRGRILSFIETCKKRGMACYSTLSQIVDAVIRKQPYPDVFDLMDERQYFAGE